jgi:hypothetical protein
VRRMLERLRDSLGHCRIVLGSLDGRTSSEEVAAFFESTAETWGVSVNGLVPRAHCG